MSDPCRTCRADPPGSPLPSHRNDYTCSACGAQGTWDGFIAAPKHHLHDAASVVAAKLLEDTQLDLTYEGSYETTRSDVHAICVLVKLYVPWIDVLREAEIMDLKRRIAEAYPITDADLHKLEVIKARLARLIGEN